jgi:hypothetical protein
MHFPGREVSPDDLLAVKKLEKKIQTDEERLRELNEKFTQAV